MSDNQSTQAEYAEHARHGALDALMSTVGQAVRRTSWFVDLEYVLWEALENADLHPFTARQMLELHELVEACSISDSRASPLRRSGSRDPRLRPPAMTSRRP
jgi:hypothetical protein